MAGVNVYTGLRDDQPGGFGAQEVGGCAGRVVADSGVGVAVLGRESLSENAARRRVGDGRQSDACGRGRGDGPCLADVDQGRIVATPLAPC